METLPSTEPNVIFIPEYIHKALIRNNFNTVEIVDYSKMRQVLTIEDLATLEAFKNVLTRTFSEVSLYGMKVKPLLPSIYEKINPEENLEFTRSVVPYGNTEKIVNSIKKYLESQAESETYYKFVSLPDIVLVVLSEGFLSSLTKPGNRLSFVKDFVKILYSRMTIKSVSQTAIFPLYLKELQLAIQ